MSVTYKSGVTGNPATQTQYAIGIAESIFASFGLGLMVTSLADGQHMTGSLHYSGLAVDFRRWDADAKGVTSSIVSALKSQLGAAYQVLLESDHVHVEYDPKGTKKSSSPLSSVVPIPDPPAQTNYALWAIGILALLMVIRK